MTLITLLSSVGPHQPNLPEDVMAVQGLLNRHTHVTGQLLVEDGFCRHKTESAILSFQRRVLAMRLADGIVSDHGPTLAHLQKSSIKPMLAPPPVLSASGNRGSTLTEDDYKRAAATLGCEVAAIRAVATQESPQGAFDSKGRPPILYERHYFSRFTKHFYDRTHHEISSRKPYAAKGKAEDRYGSHDLQLVRLDAAYKLNQEAALKSASWGAFQIMGANYRAAGFANVETFVAAMKSSAGQQLDAFANFISASPGMKGALQKKDWATFARLYNGPAYKENDYDTKIAAAYKDATK